MKMKRSESCEIVIQDNSDDNSDFLDYLSEINAPNLVYGYTKEAISVIDNCDLAIKACSGKYICFIGDDDIVMSYIVDVVDWMDRNSISILNGTRPSYSWPGLALNSTSKVEKGVLRTKPYSYKNYSRNNEQILLSKLKKGGVSMDGLPCLYHGIVKLKTLNKIYEKSGSYFPGPSPDMANATGLCLVSEESYFADFPIVITGHSINSGGGMGVRKQHAGEIDKMAHLPKNTGKEWSPSIPKYWLGKTIWAESIVKGCERMGRLDFAKKLNIGYLIGSIVIFEFGHLKNIFSGYETKNINVVQFIRGFIDNFFLRSKTFLTNRYLPNNETKYFDLPNIVDAEIIVKKELDKTVLKSKYKIDVF